MPSDTCLLALDQGTTSSRAIVFDRRGKIRARAQRELTQFYPRAGWVEHDAEEIWATQVEVAVEAMERAGLDAMQIGAIGITNQRETAVVWDRKTGKPVHRAIVWQDRRTAQTCDRLNEQGWGETIRDKTGLIIDAYFSATKVQWILEHVEGAREQAQQGRLAFGTVDSWLLWNLTGGRAHLTDVTNAARTMLFNIHRLDWDDEILELLGIPRAMLPQVRPSSCRYGETAAAAFPGGIAVAGSAGDQQAALFGQMCIEPGMSKNTYGTGSFLVLNTGTTPIPSRHKLLTTIAWQLGDQPITYALEGSIFATGAVVQWLRDGLGLIRSSDEVEKLARTEPDNGGIYLVPAFVGLGAPHWDPYARGAILGLTRGSTAGHIARAALESMCYQTMDVMDAMQADSRIEIKELRVDGGATVNDLLMQFQSDILGLPVVRPALVETTALGAAYLAGLATGYWQGTDELLTLWEVDRRFEPSMEHGLVQQHLHGWRKALERARAWEEPGQ